MKQRYSRLLTEADKFKKGDRLYNDTHGAWENIDPKMAGMFYDPNDMTPGIRDFYLEKGEKPDDVDVKDDEPLPFDFANEGRDLRLLIVMGTMGIAVTFKPENLSPSKDWIMLEYPNKAEPSWMKTSNLNQWCIEVLGEL